MENHPIESLMKSTMESIKGMIDANTIVGNPLETKDGSMIIPISKVSFGFATGGSEFTVKPQHDTKQNYPFGGGSGGGVSIKPVAFLVINDGNVKLLSLEHVNAYDKMFDTIPSVLETLKGILNKKDKPQEKVVKDPITKTVNETITETISDPINET
ncbi:MAG TPA: GerW family sporulation protein [Clostridiaceae bacterium]